MVVTLTSPYPCLDFFRKYKYLAAPPPPREKCKLRAAAL